jgi:mRNA interferase RelE/StbE
VARYSLEIRRSASREIEALPTKKGRRLVVARISKLAQDPRPPGSEKLSGQERYRVRQGLYRIVYEIEDATLVVRIVKIGHRRDVYRQ